MIKATSYAISDPLFAPVLQALRSRGYAFRITGEGLVIEWEDAKLTEEQLRAGIEDLCAKDALAKALAKSRGQKERQG